MKSAANATRIFPFSPKSTVRLWPGDFWAIPLSGGRFGCAVVTDVIRTGRASRTAFVVGLVDWAGALPPTVGDVASAKVFTQGLTGIGAFAVTGAQVLGNVPLPVNLEIAKNLRGPWVAGDVVHVYGWKTLPKLIEDHLAGTRR